MDCPRFHKRGYDIRRARYAAGYRLDNFIRLDEKFQLHLLKLARAKSEVARRDLVAKRLADLRDAERHFLPRRFQNIFELRENRLRGFGAKISDVVFALNWSDKCFEHQIERTRFRKFHVTFRMKINCVLNFFRLSLS